MRLKIYIANYKLWNGFNPLGMRRLARTLWTRSVGIKSRAWRANERNEICFTKLKEILNDIQSDLEENGKGNNELMPGQSEDLLLE